MSNPIDLRRMRHLCAAIADGSLTAAAARLGLTQPALSASIKSLEREVGVPLLRRHRSGVEPTRYADLLTAHASAIESELDHAWARLSQLKGVDEVSVRLGCGPSEATRLLPMAVAGLRGSHPEVRVFVEYGLNEVLMPMVRRGDIAFALSSVPRSATDPDLFHETLHVDDAVVVSRVGHPLARRRVLAGDDLARYPWVLARRWELERKALDELFAEAGLKPVEPVVETSSAILMKTLVLQSDYLTFVPREMIHWEARADLLRPLMGFRSSWERHVGITTRRELALAQPARWLIDALRAAATAMPR